ncbi:Cyclin, N-terminal domain family protein [Clavispora lusitaniae]|uniref:Uncharacterized protein n=1 Tax=Clavispora lusitaniae (strain ATCC 42720) TaxID=306902 RepID=C4Y1Z1_CLAL4|nr:uncharacterized protein CLUG_02223 [Clavispora lusitaniae ATCC 42720]EEQ38100.1 hypothetical protein CLUG_02223 [Clavispora lusitaniae ATCC 42720]KAF5211613.1 B-type cyclin [Clavispora lusitaniae]KAF7582989.1 Cyclin, N-terminal domain family protein [Clavispora lusitaniae]
MSHDLRSHVRSSSENINRRSSGSQRRVLGTLSTNLAASRVAKRDDTRRRRVEVKEADQENDIVASAPLSTSTQPLSDDVLIHRHFDRIPPVPGQTDSEPATPQIFSDALSDKVSNEEEEEEEEDDDDDDKIDYSGPQEPKWNRQIFNELQHVMNKYSRTTLDENDEDTYDVTMVAEYAPEIFNYLHELEHRLSPSPNYMDNQDELRWEMRGVLIDWVVQVHQRFNLLPETLFLTVNYIDRFLSRRRVSLSRFQLVGAVALFIAAKYEEINCPTVQEVAYMADNAYNIDDFLKAERFMIDVLEFDMGWPGPMSFLRRTSKADDYDYETRTLAKYFLEITIMDSRFVASQPSWLAAGAHYLSRKILNKGSWTELHVFYSGYTEEQLRPLARIFMDICSQAEQNHKAIFEKYQERRYRRSSLFVQEFLRAMRQSTRE